LFQLKYIYRKRNHRRFSLIYNKRILLLFKQPAPRNSGSIKRLIESLSNQSISEMAAGATNSLEKRLKTNEHEDHPNSSSSGDTENESEQANV
jgi:hypothetical protein